MRYLSYVLLLMMQLSFSAVADDNGSELKNLYSALNMLNQQQQAIYQQFQMVQELRRSVSPRLYGMTLNPQLVGQIANYDEVIEANKYAILRAENLHQQADQLLDKYNQIEELKQPLRQRIYELSLSK